MIVAVPVVVVHAIAIDTAIGDSHFQRAIQAEGDHGIAGNPDGRSAQLCAGHRADDLSDDAIIAPRFHTVRFGPYGITGAVDDHRFEIDDEVVIGRHADHQFRIGTARNGDAAVLTIDILVDCTVVDAVVAALDIDGLVHANWYDGTGFEASKATLAAVPIAIAVTVAILGGTN